MSLFWRAGRAPATVPAAVPDVEPERRADPRFSISDYFRLWGGGTGYAEVNASVPATSMQSIAVGSAMRLICSLGSELPVRYYARGASGGRRREVDAPSYMLDPAGDGHGEQDWRYQVLASWVARGNGFFDVLDRAPSGFPTQLLPLDPMTVSGYMDEGRPRWFVNGEDVTGARFLHTRVEPWPGHVLGRSTLEQHADTVGISLTALRFGRQWFVDGAHPSGMLTNTEVELTGDDVIAQVKARFMSSVYGSREPLVMGRGWQYKSIQVTAEESQFLKTMGWSEAQCARMFGPGMAEALGYETGGSLTYSTAESRARDLLVYAINKWLSRMDRLLTSMCPPGQYAEIVRDAMLAATTIDRFRAHHLALADAWRTINEVRDVENLEPVPWGDEPYTLAQTSGNADADADGRTDEPSPEGGTDA